MLVCHCHRVSDADVAGTGATTLRGVAKVTRAGTGCGGCLPVLRELCDQAKARQACPAHGIVPADIPADEVAV